MVEMSSSASAAFGTDGTRFTVHSVPGGGPAGVFHGEGVPSGVPAGGRPGVVYLDTNNGNLYELGINMQWSQIANMKGPAGDTEVSNADLQELANDAADRALVELDEDIPDLSALFTNVLAG